ncbi:hypothetical protein GMOD_00003930 [Pyrenophora seminiperda CCB06]|uniref:Uncharacterized protein n=1 Tax=Pyrenophora seminiperda CCB06 TaxID=1302712 RepID=A0A3M7M0D5_9PLEO|nr:hypothetical protein GMOD_00003930 [Pyrenophora seminiperda CCB06]
MAPILTISSLKRRNGPVATSQAWPLARSRPTGHASLHVTQRPGLPHFASCQNTGFVRQNATPIVHSESAEVLPASPPARTVPCYHRFSPARRSPHTHRVGLWPALQPLIHFPPACLCIKRIPIQAYHALQILLEPRSTGGYDDGVLALPGHATSDGGLSVYRMTRRDGVMTVRYEESLTKLKDVSGLTIRLPTDQHALITPK